MRTEASLNQIVRETIEIIIDDESYPVIRDRQKDSPRPNVPYAAVGLLADVRTGWDSSKLTNSGIDLQETTEGQRNITYSVQFFKENALDYARLFYTAVQRSSIISKFSAEEVGLIKVTQVQDISESLENGWEERASIDITLNYVYTDIVTTTTIESIDVDATIDDYVNTIEIRPST